MNFEMLSLSIIKSAFNIFAKSIAHDVEIISDSFRKGNAINPSPLSFNEIFK